VNKNAVLNPISNNINKQPNGADNKNGEQKILSTDLDSSLASLADNLDINYKNKNFQLVLKYLISIEEKIINFQIFLKKKKSPMESE
jgi:hypothetical protein